MDMRTGSGCCRPWHSTACSDARQLSQYSETKEEDYILKTSLGYIASAISSTLLGTISHDHLLDLFPHSELRQNCWWERWLIELRCLLPNLMA